MAKAEIWLKTTKSSRHDGTNLWVWLTQHLRLDPEYDNTTERKWDSKLVCPDPLDTLCLWQVSAQPAGRGNGALSRPEAGNGAAEEEAGGAGGATHGEGPGPGQVSQINHWATLRAVVLAASPMNTHWIWGCAVWSVWTFFSNKRAQTFLPGALQRL